MVFSLLTSITNKGTQNNKDTTGDSLWEYCMEHRVRSGCQSGGWRGNVFILSMTRLQMKPYKYCVRLFQYTKSQIIPDDFDKNFDFHILIENMTFGINSLVTVPTYIYDGSGIFIHVFRSVYCHNTTSTRFMTLLLLTQTTPHPPPLKNHFLFLLLCVRTIMETS
jgi:hypothetical protein